MKLDVFAFLQKLHVYNDAASDALVSPTINHVLHACGLQFKRHVKALRRSIVHFSVMGRGERNGAKQK